MPDDIRKLEKAYDKLKTDCATLHAKMGDAIKAISKTNKTLANTMEALRERIQELKNNGAIGTKIRDFVADRDIKMLYAVAQGYSQSAESNREDAGGKVKVKAILIDYKRLKDEVVAEINEAKDKGRNNEAKKYEDLLKKVTALESDKLGIKRLASYDPESGGSAADLDNRLKKMIAEIKPDKSKAKKAEAKGYELKAIKTMLADLRKTQSAIEHDVKAAAKAEKNADAERLAEVQASLKKAFDEFEDTVTHFEKGLKDKKVTDALDAIKPDGQKAIGSMTNAVKEARDVKRDVEAAMKRKTS